MPIFKGMKCWENSLENSLVKVTPVTWGRGLSCSSEKYLLKNGPRPLEEDKKGKRRSIFTRGRGHPFASTVLRNENAA
ncbi:hypothetical protein NPIL_216311 [Nephila pilipes]|uniref:Uncharacterized protein n=1 Tax=Nephila pilipes TaxID=299642 RepID=A0A8X6NFN6_NEPPI|nr:hypothetical protein NPIL_216311 [Nephila pilipes]